MFRIILKFCVFTSGVSFGLEDNDVSPAPTSLSYADLLHHFEMFNLEKKAFDDKEKALKVKEEQFNVKEEQFNVKQKQFIVKERAFLTSADMFSPAELHIDLR